MLRMEGVHTNEVDDEASVGGSAGGAAKEGLSVREIVERNGRNHRCGKLDVVSRVGVRVAEAEDGADRGLRGPAARVRLSVMYASYKEEDEGYRL
jgi:hypothetical protein